MHFVCRQQDLSRALSIVSRAISNKNTLPILAYVLLATEGGRLKLCATNLEISITYRVDAQIQEEGIVAVPAKLMTEFIASLSPAPVEIISSATTSYLRVTSPHTVATIKGMAPDEFPRIPEVESYPGLPILLDARLLKSMVSYVALAASTDDSRSVLTGVLARLGNEMLTLAAADSFRLAVRSAVLAEPTRCATSC